MENHACIDRSKIIVHRLLPKTRVTIGAAATPQAWNSLTCDCHIMWFISFRLFLGCSLDVMFSVLNVSCNISWRFLRTASGFHNTEHKFSSIARLMWAFVSKSNTHTSGFLLCRHIYLFQSDCVVNVLSLGRLAFALKREPLLCVFSLMLSGLRHYIRINPHYYTLLCLIYTVKHTVTMAMERLYSESFICLPDGFLALTGSVPWAGLSVFGGIWWANSECSLRFWSGSISDPVLRSTL